ncbi:hypothetical protein GIB67_020916 [Kingdonia uniflora]|uniref:Uncharacterized protein n=1 Tax=Kingdonia uniflora TaxID=39325 RepID=A0A7J7M7I4_9MAGN|nr:hypothetical protein GIB67_020916 [Kingdonia uniflora]
MGSSSVNEVSTSGRSNEPNNEGEVGLEQFCGFPGQLVSYPPGSDAFRVFCEAKAAVGGKWGKCLEFVGVKSTVERKESLLDEVTKEKTEFNLVLKGLGLSRKKSLAQPNPGKQSKIAQKYPKKEMLKVMSASGTTGSSEVANDKWRKVEPSGESREKVAEGQSSLVDDLKEVEERARLAVLQGEEDTSKMVKTKANLDEMVEEQDRLGHHLMLKGYSEEEVDVIKADTYVEEEDKEETEALGIMEGLDGISCQTVLDNQGDDVELP